MNIGVFGYYNYGNEGDQVILDTLQSIFSPHRIIPIPDETPPTQIAINRLNNFDYLILGGGGLYNSTRPPSPFYCFDKWADKLQTPIGVLGLGVETLKPEYLAATLCLVEKSDFFVVRDEESKNLIGHPKILVAPDITFYRPIRNEKSLTSYDLPRCGVNLRGSTPELQHWIRAIKNLPGPKKGLPFSIHLDMDDREPLLSVDPNCPSKFSIEFLSSIDIIVGFALHSVIFAIQSGTPVIAINYRTKVRRMMEEVGLGEYVLDIEEFDNLPFIYQKVIQDREIIKKRMLDYTASAESKLKLVLENVTKQIAVSYKPAIRQLSNSKTRPVASILIYCVGCSWKEIEVTVRSIINQTQTNLEIIAATNRPTDEESRKSFGLDDSHINWILIGENEPNWIEACLKATSSGYITWLRAGHWFQVDALAVMVNELMENRQTQFVRADHFTVLAGTAVEKVSRGSKYPKDFFNTDDLCFLMKKESASKFIQINSGKRQFESWKKQFLSKQGIYIPQGLLFRPIREWEIEIYRSAVAMSREQIEESKYRMEMATKIKAAFTIEEEETIARLHAQLIYTHLKKPKNIAVMRSINETLGKTTGLLLRQRRTIMNAIAREWFFEVLDQHKSKAVISSLFFGMQINFSDWITNRGVWRSLANQIIGKQQ